MALRLQRRAAHTSAGQHPARLSKAAPGTSNGAERCEAGNTTKPMDLLLLGTAATRIHDRSLQASATQRWAANVTTSSLNDAFDSDDALISLRRTPAVTETAASLASKVSDATAARLAHTLDRLSPDTAPVPRRQEEEVATTPRPQGKEVAEDLYARLGGTSPFRGSSPETFKPSPPRVSVARSKPTPPPKKKLVKRLTLLASRRRDRLRRGWGRWQAFTAAIQARTASIETVEASLQAAEKRREGAVSLARALTARVDAATSAALDAARLRTKCDALRRQGNARVVFALRRVQQRRAKREALIRCWGKWASSVRKEKAWASYAQDGALALSRAERRGRFFARRSLKGAWRAWAELSRTFAEFRRTAALKLQRDERREANGARVRKLLGRVRLLERRLVPDDPWAHRDIREARDGKGRTYLWERLPTAQRCHADGTPKPIRRWWKDPRIIVAPSVPARRRPKPSSEPPLHVPYRLLVLQARAAPPPSKKKRRPRKKPPAKHAPLHPRDVDAFLAADAPRRRTPLAPVPPNVNVYRVAVPF